MAFELTQDYLELLIDAIESHDDDFLRQAMDELYPADMAALLYELPTDAYAQYIIAILEEETAAQVINNLTPNWREDFLKEFSTESLARFISYLDSDDAADILNEQPTRTKEEVLALLEDREKARYIIDLLHYEEDTAGGLMAKELVKANIKWTVSQAIDEIRRQAEKVEKVNSVYVVDDNNALKGRVSLKRIVLSRATTKVADIYEDDIVSVDSHQSAEEVADIMQRYDLESVPVVNVNGRLLGRITIDDIVDVITEQAEQDRQAMTGLSGDVEEDDTVWASVKARLPWQVIGMAGGLLAAWLTDMIGKPVLGAVGALAYFMTLIAGTGGNVGVQSSSVILQSLANPSVVEQSVVRRLLKVFSIGLLNGILLSAVLFLVIYGATRDIKLSLVVSVSILSVVLLASFMGTVTPLVLDKFGVNPAVASGPFITTANDLLGLTVYFLTAKLLYSL
jgi:magnesium transporter